VVLGPTRVDPINMARHFSPQSCSTYKAISKVSNSNTIHFLDTTGTVLKLLVLLALGLRVLNGGSKHELLMVDHGGRQAQIQKC
jgi:hypothetical protein